MAGKAGGDADVSEYTEELKSLAQELRSTGRELTFMLSMVTDIVSHVGPKLQPNKVVNLPRPGPAFESLIADMQMMYSLFSNFTPYGDRKLRSFYLQVEELEQRIQELEAKSVQRSGRVSNDVGCPTQADDPGQTSSASLDVQQTQLRFVCRDEEPIKEPSKVTATFVNKEAPYSVGNSSAVGNLFFVRHSPSTKDGSTSSDVHVGPTNKETKEPSGDSSTVISTQSSSSDVSELEIVATSSNTTSSTVADVIVPVSASEPVDGRHSLDSDYTATCSEEKEALSTSATKSATEPTYVILDSDSTVVCAEDKDAPSSATKSTEMTSSTATDSDVPDAKDKIPSPVSAAEPAELTTSISTDADLSIPDGQGESSEAVEPTSSASSTTLQRITGKETVPSSETSPKPKECRVASSTIPTALVTPRVSPIVLTESVNVTLPPSPAESNQSQTPSTSPLMAVTYPTPTVVSRETVTSLHSSPAEGNQSPTLSTSSSSPSSPITPVAAREVYTETSSTPIRSNHSNESRTYTGSPSYVSYPSYPSYPSTPTYSTPTYGSRSYSSSSTSSAASSTSSSGTSTSTKKYASFVSEPMRDKPVTKVGGVGAKIGSRLRASGYTQASDLHDKFQSLGGNRQQFQTWFQKTTGGNSRHANDCYNSFSDYNY